MAVLTVMRRPGVEERREARELAEAFAVTDLLQGEALGDRYGHERPPVSEPPRVQAGAVASAAHHSRAWSDGIPARHRYCLIAAFLALIGPELNYVGDDARPAA